MRLSACLCVSVLSIGAASPALALANRVFVSARSGNNANSCDNINTPCQTFAGAVLQLNAGGEAIVLDSGGYGPVTVTKSLTIEAPPGVLAFIHPPSGDAITINAGASDTVILRGLTLNGGTSNGINAITVGQLFVEHCTITGFVGFGIIFGASGGTLFMRDDDVRKCSTAVMVVSNGAAARAVIRDSSFAQNAGSGVWAGEGSIVVVTDSVAAGNDLGFRAESFTVGGVADMTLERVKAVFNRIGLWAFADIGPATLRFAYCTITQNNGGVAALATVVGSSPGTSIVAGNTSDLGGSLGSGMVLK